MGAVNRACLQRMPLLPGPDETLLETAMEDGRQLTNSSDDGAGRGEEDSCYRGFDKRGRVANQALDVSNTGNR